MKQFLFALLACTVISSAFGGVPDTPQTRKQFKEFIQQNDKHYSTPEEFQERYANFLNALERIQHKQEISKDTVSYGITKYSDNCIAEINSRRMKKTPAAEYARSCLASGVTAPELETNAIPTSFDWRTKGVVTPVKNQGQCGSCWAFSTIANIESMNAINGNPLTQFSEQMIVDCSHACCEVEGEASCNSGCDGGWMWTAMTDVIAWGGVNTEEEYPYVGEDESCKMNNQTLQAPAKNYTCVGTDEGQIAAFLVATGPLSVALNADLVEDYTSGIIDPWFPSEECDPTTLDHAVLIVGYGVDDTFGFDTPYWIVKNSWGADWGENGYFRMYRGDGCCGINNAVTCIVMK